MPLFSGFLRHKRVMPNTEAQTNARDKNGRLHLSAIAALWPTPTAFDWNTSVKSRTEKGSITYKHNLKEAVQIWPTPQSRDFRSGQSDRVNRHGKQNNLNDMVQLWPTPRNNTGPSTDKKHLSLDGAVSLWPTPRTAGMCGGTGNWNQLKVKCAGIEESRQMGAGNGGQLNPDWVEALMGYPQGWTDIEKEADTYADYPGAWLDGTWEDGIPRVASGVKNRVSRLKVLGNAIVPQIAAYLWRLIKAALWN